MTTRRDWTSFVTLAETLIQRFGQDATLTKPGALTGDSWNPGRGAGVPTTVQLVDVRGTRMDGPQGVTTKEHDVLISTSAGVEPEHEDELTFGGETVGIASVETINPGGTALLYLVKLKT